MENVRNQVLEATATVREHIPDPPDVAIVLGTGLGRLAEEIQNPRELPYSEIPHFPLSTVESHAGSFISGELDGKRVLAMKGRFHHYEGYDARQITLPVRVMREMGASVLLLSGASGGMNPTYQKGDLVILEDHLNLMGINPLIGVKDPELGPRFPDMSAPYDPELIRLGLQIAEEEGIPAHRGVYVAVAGPNLETRAEYRFLRGIGADVVGMSTVPEVIVAAQVGFRVFGCSLVTDMCIPETLQPTSIEEVIEVATQAEPALTRLMRLLVQRLEL